MKITRNKILGILCILSFVVFGTFNEIAESRINYVEGSKLEDVTEINIWLDLFPDNYYFIFDTSGVIGGRSNNYIRIQGTVTIIHMISSPSQTEEIFQINRLIDEHKRYRYSIEIPQSDIESRVLIDIHATEKLSVVLLTEDNLSNFEEADQLISYGNIALFVSFAFLALLIFFWVKRRRKRKRLGTENFFKTTQSLSSQPSKTEINDIHVSSRIEYCLACGVKNDLSQEFCSNCGTRVWNPDMKSHREDVAK